MSKFTKGKWKADTEYDCAVYACDMQMKIADIRGWGYLTGKGIGGLGLSPEKAREIQDANARLIAAAPEMYELLKSVGAYHSGIVWGMVCKARELLARIDGEVTEA